MVSVPLRSLRKKKSLHLIPIYKSIYKIQEFFHTKHISGHAMPIRSLTRGHFISEVSTFLFLVFSTQDNKLKKDLSGCYSNKNGTDRYHPMSAGNSFVCQNSFSLWAVLKDGKALDIVLIDTRIDSWSGGVLYELLSSHDVFYCVHNNAKFACGVALLILYMFYDVSKGPHLCFLNEMWLKKLSRDFMWIIWYKVSGNSFFSAHNMVARKIPV